MLEYGVEETICQSIDEAGTCQEELDSAGIFNSDRAKEVIGGLVAAFILELIKSLSTVAKARETMRMALEEDPSFKDGYISNIAGLLQDKYGVTDYEQRNRAAEDILRLIFW